MRKVIRGKAINCDVIPTIRALGFVNKCANSLGLIPNATPNITNAKIMLMVCIPAALKLIFTGSNADKDSYMIFDVKRQID